MRRLVWLLAAGMLGSAGASSATVTSGLHGLVTRGPIRPVCSVGQPCDEPAANVTLVFLRNGSKAVTTRTNAAGLYRLSLRPGTYAVRLPGKQSLAAGSNPQSPMCV